MSATRISENSWTVSPFYSPLPISMKASRQLNVIGLVCIGIYVSEKTNIETEE